MSEGISAGEKYEDSVFGDTFLVKYADDDVVLLMGEDQHHHIYDRDDFDTASERTLIQTENRFTKVTNDN